MPRKKIAEYFKKDDFFIYDRTIWSNNKETYNEYYYVFFPPYLNIYSKAFNKIIYKKEDAIKYRNEMMWIYINKPVNNEYKDIFKNHLNKCYIHT